MPFIIHTTPGRLPRETDDAYNMRAWASSTHIAVASLDDLPEYDIPDAGYQLVQADGTIVECEPITYMALQASLPNTTEYLTLSPAGLIRAYNEQINPQPCTDGTCPRCVAGETYHH